MLWVFKGMPLFVAITHLSNWGGRKRHHVAHLLTNGLDKNYLYTFCQLFSKAEITSKKFLNYRVGDLAQKSKDISFNFFTLT